MPTKRITLVANNIDGAAEQIIHLLEDTDKGGDIIYFHGWYGWGASAVLKEVVKRQRSSLGSADTGTAGGLEKIIHVDFPRGQSKRALQKTIAEELGLPQQVMALFDQHDEEDDFDGVEQSVRGVIPHVKVAILNELNARRFLMVLHNWSGGYIELREVGVPLIGEWSKRALWTSRGRFWPHVTARHAQEDDVEEFAGLSDVAIRVEPTSSSRDEDGRNILYAEIEDIAKYTGVPEPDMSPKIVTECILYRAARGNDHDISWESHASNYWVCDGIIHDAANGGRSAWEISDALQRNMNLDLCNECAEADCICEALSGDRWWRHTDRWFSMTSQSSVEEVEVPSLATSFFCTRAGSSSVDHESGTTILEAGLFEHSDCSSLRVMHLSYCNFSFSSPPFLSCNNIRFLLLDHCKNQDTQDLGEEKESHCHSQCSQQDGGACFRNLWVLELSYTDWYWLLSKDMLDLMVDLRELNVKGVGNRSMMHLHRCSGAGSNRRSLVKLRVVSDDDDDGTSSGKRNQQVSPPVVAFPDVSSWHILKTVILEGCGDLEQIDCNALPLPLESFTLISSVTTSSKIKRISFQGRTRLKSILLIGLFDSLVELDMSGTAIRTLDLSTTQAWGLRRLFLLGCEALCAILWPHEKGKEIWLDILRIGTTTTTYATWDREEGKSSKQEATASDSASISIGSSSSAMVRGKEGRTIIDLDSYISIRDPRLFRSLMSLRHNKWLHVEISSTGPGHKAGTTGQGINTSGGCGSAAVNAHKPSGSLYADDIIIISTSNGSNSQADDDASRDVFKADLVMRRRKWLWRCPPIPKHFNWAHCYISIQDEPQTRLLLQSGTVTSTSQLIINRATTLPTLVSSDAETLHLHDNSSITCLPGPAPGSEEDLDWYPLKWCRLERCPNLEGVVFNEPPARMREGSIFASKKKEKKEGSIFENLETFWASQLPKTRYIWDWSTTSLFHPGFGSFEALVFLHLDDCPRLVHVLPLYTSNPDGCRSLETLEIVCCGDLRVVFPSYPESQQQEEPREFPSLKRIHLYNLPKLQRICGHSRMLAPNLETVKIRGCWGLKRLPTVGCRSSSTPPPVVDCEKDWWDGLEWDEESGAHHPSHYKPTYSAYYKKKQLRASVLR